MNKKYNNKYYILRHGESIANRKKIISCWPEIIPSPLTKKGREQIKTQAKKLKTKKIDLIFASDLLRTRQTAEIAAKGLKIKPRYDKRLREYNVGVFNGKPVRKVRELFPVGVIRFKNKPPKGETYKDVQKRMDNFLKEIDKKYSGKNILIISHEASLTLLEGEVRGLSDQEIIKRYPKAKRIKTGELRKLNL